MSMNLDGYAKLIGSIEKDGMFALGDGGTNREDRYIYSHLDVRAVEEAARASPEGASFLQQSTERSLSGGVKIEVDGVVQDLHPSAEEKIINFLYQVPFHALTKGLLAARDVVDKEEAEVGAKRKRDSVAAMVEEATRPDDEGVARNRVAVLTTEAGCYLARVNKETSEGNFGFRLDRAPSHAQLETIAGTTDVSNVTPGEQDGGMYPSKEVRVFVWPQYRPDLSRSMPLTSRLSPLVPYYLKLVQMRELSQTASTLASNPPVLYVTAAHGRTALADHTEQADSTHLFQMAVQAAQSHMSVKDMNRLNTMEQSVAAQKVSLEAMRAYGLVSRSVSRHVDELGVTRDTISDPVGSLNMRPVPPGHTTASYPQAQPPRDMMLMEEKYSNEVRATLGMAPARSSGTGARSSTDGTLSSASDLERTNRLALELRDLMRTIFPWFVEKFGNVVFAQSSAKIKKEHVAKATKRVRSAKDILTWMRVEGTLEDVPQIAQAKKVREHLKESKEAERLSKAAEAAIAEFRMEYGLEVGVENVYNILRRAESEKQAADQATPNPFQGRRVNLVFNSQIIPNLTLLFQITASGSIRADETARILLGQIGIPDDRIDKMVVPDEQRIEMEAKAAAKVSDIKDTNKEAKKAKKEGSQKK